MKDNEMICGNCDYFEPWVNDDPSFVYFYSEDLRSESWGLEINGSCRRRPPVPVSQSGSGSVYPYFPVVNANYWCGEGRWTDPETGNRLYWGDWEE